MKKTAFFLLSILMMIGGGMQAWAYDGTPYGGTNWSIPGKIQTEDFDEGGEGVAYHDQDGVNEGNGYRSDVGVDIHDGTWAWDNDDNSPVIGWFRSQEWMNYTVDVEAGVYEVTLRLGTPNNDTGIEIYLDDSLLLSYSIPSTGSWSLQNIVATSDLVIPEGGTGKVLTIKNPAALGLSNIDYDFSSFTFTKVSDISTGSSVTVNIDFGVDSNTSGDGWNNFYQAHFTNPTPLIVDLIDSNGNNTGIEAFVSSRPNSTNPDGGVPNPDSTLNLPVSATIDSYFGSTGTWNDTIVPSFEITFQNLDVNTAYNLSVYGSRLASDTREAMFVASGQNADSVALNTSNNTSEFPTIESIYPNAEGKIILTAKKGPNNNNSVGFYYLGAIRMTYILEGYHELSVSTVGKGTVTPVSGSYEHGSSVTLTAVPNPGWKFDGWSGGATGTESSLTITMDAAKNITATFVHGTPTGVINIDFGDNQNMSGPGWNNFVQENLVDTVVNIINLIDSDNIGTGITAYIYDTFRGVNINGTQTPDSTLGLPVSATSDSYYAHTEPWSGYAEPTGGIIFENLDVNKSYSFSVFGSRDATDNREGMYVAMGQNTDSVAMNGASNTSEFSTISNIYPDAEGKIRLLAKEGPNNTNGSGFFYLGVVKITYDGTIMHALTVDTEGNGSVTPESDNYIDGSSVTLKAIPDAGWKFTGWSGDITETESTATITMDEAKNITATFELGTPTGVINIDFGDHQNMTSPGWNNFVQENLQDTIPILIDLIDSDDVGTGIVAYTYDAFRGVNTNGTQTPDSILGLPASATSDSYYAHTEPWSGYAEPTGGIIFENLTPNTAYSFSVFGSRDATDNREGMYVAMGQNTDSVAMNGASNTSEFPTISNIYPDAEGKIRLLAKEGPNNTNGSGFFYLGVVKITYSIGYTGTPYGGTPRTIPGIINAGEYDEGGEGVAYHDAEAENLAESILGSTYRPTEAVDVNNDGGIGWFKDGEWLNYTVNVVAGTYDLIVMTATKQNDTKLEIYLDDELLTTIDIPNNGSYSAYTETTVSGIEIAEGGDGKILRFQNVNNDYTFLSVEFVKKYSGTPYGGTPRTIPGLINAGEYDEGGEGVAYHDTEVENLAESILGSTYRPTEAVDVNEDGGIGWFKDGEWLNYTVDVQAGTYDLFVMTATKQNDTKLEIYLDNTLLTTVEIPNNGSYTSYTETKVSGVEIAEGGNGMILRFQNVNNDYTFLSVEFKEATSSKEFDMSNINAFPVPFSDHLTLSNIPLRSSISVFSIAGSKVMEIQNGNSDRIELGTSHLKAGIYILKVNNASSPLRSIKVIKK